VQGGKGRRQGGGWWVSGGGHGGAGGAGAGQCGTSGNGGQLLQGRKAAQWEEVAQPMNASQWEEGNVGCVHAPQGELVGVRVAEKVV